jgi:hypothetical protein
MPLQPFVAHVDARLHAEKLAGQGQPAADGGV